MSTNPSEEVLTAKILARGPSGDTGYFTVPVALLSKAPKLFIRLSMAKDESHRASVNGYFPSIQQPAHTDGQVDGTYSGPPLEPASVDLFLPVEPSVYVLLNDFLCGKRFRCPLSQHQAQDQFLPTFARRRGDVLQIGRCGCETRAFGSHSNGCMSNHLWRLMEAILFGEKELGMDQDFGKAVVHFMAQGHCEFDAAYVPWEDKSTRNNMTVLIQRRDHLPNAELTCSYELSISRRDDGEYVYRGLKRSSLYVAEGRFKGRYSGTPGAVKLACLGLYDVVVFRKAEVVVID